MKYGCAPANSPRPARYASDGINREVDGRSITLKFPHLMREFQGEMPAAQSSLGRGTQASPQPSRSANTMLLTAESPQLGMKDRCAKLNVL